MAPSLTDELASAAARLIVEEGMEYGPAKRRAARDLGKRSTRSVDLPDNEQVEEEVRAYIALFYADTQPAELRALRDVALIWMERLEPFRPHLHGAVWRGTATRLNSVRIELFCDDSKEAELALIDRKVSYDVGSLDGPRGDPIDVLTVSSPSAALATRTRQIQMLSTRVSQWQRDMIPEVSRNARPWRWGPCWRSKRPHQLFPSMIGVKNPH